MPFYTISHMNECPPLWNPRVKTPSGSALSDRRTGSFLPVERQTYFGQGILKLNIMLSDYSTQAERLPENPNITNLTIG